MTADVERIVVIGEALIDIIPDGSGGVVELPGGSPANVAVTLGRLGRSPSLVTVLADDDRGRAIRDWLEASQVHVTALLPASGRTSTAAVTLNPDGVPTYDFDLTWDPALPQLLAASQHAAVIHVGSIATVLEPGAAAVLAAVEAARGTALISFDPNARPAITADVTTVLPQVERLVALSDVVKVSDEDLAWYYPDLDPVAVAHRWATAGPGLVIVTRGGAGAVAVRGRDVVEVPGVPVTVADTVGAGDTFSGALIDALLTLGVQGRVGAATLAALPVDLVIQAVTWATKAAAITVSRAGANPPTRAELLDF